MAIRRSNGITDSEVYLNKLCESTFLKLWSYPNLYHSPGKELCDLLVVFGNHIIIFSDKDCKFPNNNNLDLDWQRWFRSAIHDPANQAWGAERSIKMKKSLFSNEACTEPFHMEIPDPKTLMFHIVVVAHGSSMRCHEELGGSGSLLIASNIQGHTQHKIAFSIGDIDPKKTFVHVLDDTSLDIVLKTLDTISDFVDYLTKKEKLLRSSVFTVATGEEDLLAYYLQNINEDKKHDFIIPATGEILFIDKIWDDFSQSSLRQAQKLADKVSYYWDDLIEEFSKQTLEDNIYIINHPELKLEEAFKLAEISLRCLAQEPRFYRRILAQLLSEWIIVLPKNGITTKCILNPEESRQKTGYVFLYFPHSDEETVEEYQRMRCKVLESCCVCLKINHPQIQHIVGISIELNSDYKKWIILYVDATQLTEKDINKAKELIQPLNIMTNAIKSELYVAEYPYSKDTSDNLKNY